MMLDIPLWTNDRHAPLVGTSRSEEVAKKTENAAKKFVIKTVQICTKSALEKGKTCKQTVKCKQKKLNF